MKRALSFPNVTRRFLIFGLIGPLGTYLSVCAVTNGMSANWADLPQAYGIELAPFLLCACIDGWLNDARFWERAIVAGFVGLVTSAVAFAIAFSPFGLAVMISGVFAIVPAAFCSLLSTLVPAKANLS